MARKQALPKGTLSTLIDEVEPTAASHEDLPVRTRARKGRKAVPPYTRAARATKRKGSVTSVSASPARTRPAVEWNTDPVSRYAASRGLPIGAGPVQLARLAFQYAVDVREVAKKERTNVLDVVSRALANFLTEYDRR